MTISFHEFKETPPKCFLITRFSIRKFVFGILGLDSILPVESPVEVQSGGYSMKTIENKTTLITGAASGIGRETALMMAQKGARIVALDRDEEGLGKLTNELSDRGEFCFPIVCDLASASDTEMAVRKVVNKMKGVDFLINNAGIGYHGATHEMPRESFEQVLQINLHAPCDLFQHLVHELIKSDVGHVVNVASIFGLVPHPRTAAYCASKYGLVGFTEAIRAEYGRWGLGVSMVCPGFVQTPMLESLPEQSETGQKLRKPSKWLTTTPDKIARKIVKAIRYNKRLVLATPLAHFLYHTKRLFPGTCDFVQSFKMSGVKSWFRKKKSTQPVDAAAQPAANRDNALDESQKAA